MTAAPTGRATRWHCSIRRATPSVLRLSRNFGKEAALTAAWTMRMATSSCAMDADGQHPVSLIPQMLARWREGYEMVYARAHRPGHGSAFKRIGTRLFYKLDARAGEIDIPPMPATSAGWIAV